MSEQARIIAEIHGIVMGVLKTGSASVEEADKIDELEALLYQQKCYEEINHDNHAYLGEEIATLFFNDHYSEGIEKMCENEIAPDDFFGFTQYHYDDHEDEELAEMFTNVFIKGVNEAYELQCKSK